MVVRDVYIVVFALSWYSQCTGVYVTQHVHQVQREEEERRALQLE